MKAYLLQVLVIDHDNYGPENFETEIELSRSAQMTVLQKLSADIGEWSDDHPLNSNVDRKRYISSMIWKEV